MPSKTKSQKRKAQRIEKRGGSDLNNGHVTPRAIRFGLTSGQFVMAHGAPPKPPEEWRPWKRDRFALSVRAAHLFLRGKELDDIGPLIGKGKVGSDVTKQRIAQMVSEGVRFFLDRRFVEAV